MKIKKRIVIIGGGAAGIMTALHLSSNFDVCLVEKEKTLGRKLLVAGKGGFNLTNNASHNNLKESYTPKSLLEKALDSFSTSDLRMYLKSLGIETYVGSSNRVFPIVGIKPVEVLNVFLRRIQEKNVTVLLNHSLVNFTNSEVLLLDKEKKPLSLSFDYCIMALGGASWGKTGSDGLWLKLFQERSVTTLPFESSNCGVNIKWNSEFIKNHEGKPLKNISLSVNSVSVRGEALVTEYGLEGNAIYPIIKEVRSCLGKGENVVLRIDFKPNNSLEELQGKLEKVDSKSYSKKINLNTLEMSLLKKYTSKKEYLDSHIFSKKVKCLEVPIVSLRSIEESISTVGGVSELALKNDFSLKAYPNVYTIGEMVSWDAPTGGYLLQACFSMGAYVAKFINNEA